jgi:hypothetical protein
MMLGGRGGKRYIRREGQGWEKIYQKRRAGVGQNRQPNANKKFFKTGSG